MKDLVIPTKQTKQSWTYFRNTNYTKEEPKRKLLAVLLAGEVRKISIAGQSQRSLWVDVNQLSSSSSS